MRVPSPPITKFARGRLAPLLSGYSAPTPRLHAGWPHSAQRWRRPGRQRCRGQHRAGGGRVARLQQAGHRRARERLSALGGGQLGAAQPVRRGDRAARIRPLRWRGRRRGARRPRRPPSPLHRDRPHDSQRTHSAPAVHPRRGRRDGGPRDRHVGRGPGEAVHQLRRRPGDRHDDPAWGGDTDGPRPARARGPADDLDLWFDRTGQRHRAGDRRDAVITEPCSATSLPRCGPDPSEGARRQR